MSIKLSIIIPCYNEQERIASTLQKIVDFLRTQTYQAEIVIVSDGCTDDTIRWAAQYQRYCYLDGIRLSILPLEHRGKGSAVRHGMMNACGSYMMMCDADLSMPISETGKLLDPLFIGSADIAIGSRAIRGADVHTSILRWATGRIFNGIANLVVPGIRDTQCGFKIFSRTAAQHVFALAKLDHFAFDVEALYLARRLDYRVVEIPICWVNDRVSTVRIVHDSWSMFWDVLRIPIIHRPHLAAASQRAA